jgi:hypothetical protein
LGEAKASGNLGNTLKVMGKFEEAVICCRRHLEICRSRLLTFERDSLTNSVVDPDPVDPYLMASRIWVLSTNYQRF